MSTVASIGLVVLGCYLLVINLVTFCMYRSDKKRAQKGEWRIKERTLIGMAFIGGGVGALLGMYKLRHKTQHKQFVILVPVGLIVSIILAAGIVWLLLKL